MLLTFANIENESKQTVYILYREKVNRGFIPGHRLIQG